MTPWLTIEAEIGDVLRRVESPDMDAAAAFFADRGGRWFFTGQGRSGLVSRMAAMRMMHLDRSVSVVGEPTAPAIRPGDHLVALSNSGETAVTCHVAGTAAGLGCDILAITSAPRSSLAGLASSVLRVPVEESSQFGGSLFEQCSLLLLDAVVLRLSGPDEAAQRRMAARHANLE